MNSKRKSLLGMAALCSAALLPALVRADDAWPSRPIRLILPYPPGGATDRLARLVASGLAEHLKQTVIVDNRPGATGALGSGAAAKSAPDGHTLLVGFLGSMVLLPLLNRHISYDSQRDFTATARMATYDFVLVARPGFSPVDMAGIVSLGKSQGQAIPYGTTGIGSPSHLAMENFAKRSGARLQHVPYKGEQPMVMDLLGDHLELGLLTLNIAEPLLKSGKIKAIAIASPQRAKKMPDLPTFAESGFPELSFEAWAGLMAPRGTPAVVVERISSALAAVLRQPQLQSELIEAGFTPAHAGPDAFSKLIDDELTRYRRLISVAGVQVQ